MYQLAEPDRRRFGHVDVVFSSKCLHVWMGKGRRLRWGPGREAQNGAVDFEHGKSKGRSLLLRTKSHHQSKRDIFALVQ
jgi:hypothetical protein